MEYSVNLQRALKGVRDYSDDSGPLTLQLLRLESGCMRWAISSTCEDGYAVAAIDLADLLTWFAKRDPYFLLQFGWQPTGDGDAESERRIPYGLPDEGGVSDKG